MIPFVVTLQITKDGVSGVATRIIHAATKNTLQARLQRRIQKRMQPGETFQVLSVVSLYELQEFACES